MVLCVRIKWLCSCLIVCRRIIIIIVLVVVTYVCAEHQVTKANHKGKDKTQRSAEFRAGYLSTSPIWVHYLFPFHLVTRQIWIIFTGASRHRKSEVYIFRGECDVCNKGKKFGYVSRKGIFLKGSDRKDGMDFWPQIKYVKLPFIYGVVILQNWPCFKF